MKRGDAFGIALIALVVMLPIGWGALAYLDRKHGSTEPAAAVVFEVRATRTVFSGKCASAKTKDGFLVDVCKPLNLSVGQQVEIIKRVGGVTGRVTYEEK